MNLTTALTTSVGSVATKFQAVVDGNLPAVFLILGAFIAIGCIWRLVRKGARVGGSSHHRGRAR